eukprot:1157963-Pelagomonas_calceolata.AAC.1
MIADLDVLCHSLTDLRSCACVAGNTVLRRAHCAIGSALDPANRHDSKNSDTSQHSPSLLSSTLSQPSRLKEL